MSHTVPYPVERLGAIEDGVQRVDPPAHLVHAPQGLALGAAVGHTGAEAEPQALGHARRGLVPQLKVKSDHWRSGCDAAAAAAAASFEFKKPVQKFLRRPHQGTNVAEQVFQPFLFAVQLVVQLHQFRVTVVRWRLLKGGEVEEVGNQ